MSRSTNPDFEYNPENIGTKIKDGCVYCPNHMYYVFMALHSNGYFKQLANGTTNLVSIKTSDIKRFAFKPDKGKRGDCPAFEHD